MNCRNKRTIFELFNVYNCNQCIYHKTDEIIHIGNNIIAIYYLFNNCKHIELDCDYLIFNSKKLKLLLKDAVINQDEIILFFIENFKLEQYYDIFTSILDSGLSVQVITF